MIKIQQLHVHSYLLTLKLQMCNRSTHSDVLLSVSVPVNDLQETLHHSTGHQGLHTYRKNKPLVYLLSNLSYLATRDWMQKSLTILVAGQVIQEGKQGSGIFLWERRQQRICPKVKNNQYVSTKFKTFFFNQIEHVIQISQFSYMYISEEIKMVYPSCAGYMNVQAPEETRDRTRLQLHQLCYSI